MTFLTDCFAWPYPNSLLIYRGCMAVFHRPSSKCASHIVPFCVFALSYLTLVLSEIIEYLQLHTHQLISQSQTVQLRWVQHLLCGFRNVCTAIRKYVQHQNYVTQTCELKFSLFPCVKYRLVFHKVHYGLFKSYILSIKQYFQQILMHS